LTRNRDAGQQWRMDEGTMKKHLTRGMQLFLLFLVCLTAARNASGQASASQILNQVMGTGSTSSAGTSPASGNTDPLGRGTPRGAVFGFLESAQLGKYDTAAQYLQLSNARRRIEGQQVAEQLLAVINREFAGDVNRITNRPEGTDQIGMPPGYEQVGTLGLGDTEVPLVLVRVTDDDGDKIWLVSSDTLSRLPELYRQTKVHQLETHLPPPLVQFRIVGMPAWQWVALLLLIPVALGVAWLLIRLVLTLMWVASRLKKQSPKPALRGVSTPLLLVVATVLHWIGVGYLDIPVLLRAYYGRIAWTVFIVAFTWLCSRILRSAMEMVERRAIAAGRAGIGSLVLLGQRIAKAVLILFAMLLVFRVLGFNMGTALAGVGIGGIAIALGAQKSLENLIGGIAVLTDEVIRVGDVCRFGNKSGVVEDISLRSTRIRTDERTELSIPNGMLATMNVENLSRRDKILFEAKLDLRYETTPDQLRAVLAEIRRTLYEHPKVEQETAGIRFSGCEDHALRVELSCYLLTTNDTEYLAIREDLLLRVFEMVKAAGTGFALPSRTVYLTGDPGLDVRKTAETEERVKQWREHHELPFPDFNPDKIPSLRDQIVYPAPESAVRNEDREPGTEGTNSDSGEAPVRNT
jgi:MscS family membrane protein